MGLCLIHADQLMNELAEITEFDSFSAIITTDRDADCDWELTMPEGAWRRCPIRPGHYICIEGSEWGGPVEQVRHVSSEGQIRLRGTCWRGLLRRRVVAPPAGQTHVTLPVTEGNAAIAALMGGWQSRLFAVSPANSGLLCSASLRYRTLLDALEDMLAAAGGRLSAVFGDGRVLLSACPVRDMSEMVELSQEYDARLLTDHSVRVYDHIIALGRGEMLERQVVELWLLPDGTLTDDVSLVSDPDSVSTLLYDYSAVESPDELEQAARSRLLSYASESSMEIEMTDNIGLELTDTASVRDTLTGMTAVLTVTACELTVRPSGTVITHHLC